jgi:type 2 lantibiotic biosynthesis protein LanM
VVGSDLYDGLAGISLFLTYLASITSHKPLRRLADGALRTLEMRLPELRATQSIGAFDGLGGLVYVYTHVGALWGDNTFTAKASDFLTDIAARIPEDRRLDVIGGSAGCILCLLSLNRQSPSTRALELAISCGDHLIAALRKTPEVFGAEPDGLRYKRGFSHGYSGIAWALSELGSIAGESRFMDAAMDFLALERLLLSGGRWTNPEDSQLSGQASWCHGAPGIALGRLAMFNRLRDPQIRSDAELGLQRTSQSFDLDNHGLCHGQLGNLETLLFASETFPADAKWGSIAGKYAKLIIDDIAAHGWRVARPSHVEVPGLMTGLAGIGFELLRLAYPSKIPSVLLLEPPRDLLLNSTQ